MEAAKYALLELVEHVDYEAAKRNRLYGAWTDKRMLRLADAYWQGRWKGMRHGPLHVLDKHINYIGDRRSADGQLREIFMGEYYAPRMRPSLIVDAGSNNGSSILWFKLMYPEARILGFEPFPLSMQQLRRNVEENHLENITLVEQALSDADGEAEFYYYEGQGSSNSLRPGAGARTITVRTARLSAYLTDRPGLLKMDIEGGEDAVIRDLAASGKLGWVDEVIMEYHPHCPTPLHQMLAVLADNGYEYDVKAKTQIPFTRVKSRLLIRAWRKT